MMVLIRFWRIPVLTKKDCVKTARYGKKKKFLLYPSFRMFFYGSGFLANPDSEKKSDPDPRKKTQIWTLHFRASVTKIRNMFRPRCLYGVAIQQYETLFLPNNMVTLSRHFWRVTSSAIQPILTNSHLQPVRVEEERLPAMTPAGQASTFLPITYCTTYKIQIGLNNTK